MGLSSTADRLVSLDAFRGAVIACMILINNPGTGEHIYGQLDHVPWHGWTFADLIAPCFLWVIGVTTVLSLSRRLENASSRLSVLRHVLKRALVLYLVGLCPVVFSMLLPPFEVSVLGSVKFMGVLQRIAICYFLGSAIFLSTSSRGIAFWTALLLIVYWALFILTPHQEGAGGVFERGSNLAHYIDQKILGAHGETSSHPLLSILTATATVLLGTLVGRLLQSKVSDRQKALWIAGAGIALVCLGLLLDPWIPINRRLWTPSYCLFTAGISMTIFAGFYWFIEVRNARKGFGLLVAYGLNPIFLFVLSELGRMLANVKGFVDSNGTWRSLWNIGWKVFVPMAGPQGASLIFGLTYTLFFGLLAVFMRRKGWIVKI